MLKNIVIDIYIIFGIEFQGARESRKCYGWVVLCMRTRMRIRKEILLADDYSVTILFYSNN